VKWTVMLAVLLGVALGAQSSRQLNVAIFHFEDPSCGAWARSAKNEFARAQYLFWFRGFVSGYNYGDQRHQVPLDKMPDLDTVALYIDKFCRENPLIPFKSAAVDLVDELRPTSP
jgi:hypothetical protein